MLSSHQTTTCKTQCVTMLQHVLRNVVVFVEQSLKLNVCQHLKECDVLQQDILAY